MSASAGSNAAGVPLQLGRPPSLRRMGPAELTIENASGLGQILGRHGYHLRHGRRYTLRVRPQPPDDDGQTTNATSEGSEAVLPLTFVPAGPVGTLAGHTATFRPRLRWIFPARSELTVTLAMADVPPLSLVLPVIIWPSFWRQCVWAVGLIITIVSARYVALVQRPDGDPFSCLTQVATDLVFLGGVAGVAALLWLGLRAGALVWLLSGGPGG
jgi:hypothetical protein